MSFICNECGTRYPKWIGRCSACGKWETIAEEKEVETLNLRHLSGQAGNLVDLATLKTSNIQQHWQTNVAEFDVVTGGGIVPASIGLLGGEPGIGKSTLILQLIGRLCALDKKCFYVSGEESADQIKLRANRLAVNQNRIMVLIESELEKIIAHIDAEKPDFVVLDSIQTLYSKNFEPTAGSLMQIRECTFFLTQYAKVKGCAFLLVAHVTKEGNIAGPKTVEHMVDYVLYLEGAASSEYRYLRAFKNRFGAINEVGFFKMTAKGLAEVKHPNRIFMEQFSQGRSGNVIFPANEGSRIVFLEVQALVGNHPTNFPSRTALGIERNRLLILLASLEKHLKLNLSRVDVYLNIAGGVKTSDPAVDMAILGAIYSSLKNISFRRPLAMLGEASLAGEFNSPSHLKEKLSALAQAKVDGCLFGGRKKPGALADGFIAVADFKALADAINSLERK